MGRDWRRGQMELVIEETMLKERSMVLVVSLGPMAVLIQDSFMKIILRDLECISGQTGGSMKGSGRIIKWRDMGYSLGQTAGSIKENI